MKKEKKRVKGLVINKFRGDVTILEPGITMLEEKAEVPVVGVVPYMSVTLDDEDSLAVEPFTKEHGSDQYRGCTPATPVQFYRFFSLRPDRRRQRSLCARSV